MTKGASTFQGWKNEKLALQPNGYLWVYQAALRTFEVFGQFRPEKTPATESPSRFVFSQLYLAGRWLQNLFGLLLLAALWLTTHKLFGLWPAVLATGTMAVLPGMVATSHFSQNSLPVTTLSFLSLACMIFAVKDSAKEFTWMRLAAVIAGIAFGTKYSAAMLVLPLAYCCWRSSNRWRLFGEVAVLGVMGFLLTNPYALLAPKLFIERFRILSGWLRGDIPGFVNKAVFPFFYPLSYSGGTLALIGGVAGIVWGARKREPEHIVLLLWLAGLLFGIYRCGSMSSPARVLPFFPGLLVLVAGFFSHFFESKAWRKLAAAGGAVMFVGTAIQGLMISRLHSHSEPPQKQASAWMIENIAPGVTVGLLEAAFFWTPDVLYLEAPDQPNYKASYKTQVVTDLAQAKSLPYLLIANIQRTKEREALLAGLAAEGFEQVVQFRPLLQFGPFTWRRAENPFQMPEDDLWANSLTLYSRKPARVLSPSVAG